MKTSLPNRALVAVLTVAVGFLTAATAQAGSLRTLTLGYHGVLIGSGSLDENYAGVARFQIPTSWHAVKKGRFYNLTPPAINGCTIKVQVNNQPTLTKVSTGAQVAAALPDGLRIAELGRGSRAQGSWGLDETAPHVAPPGRRVYAIGVIHLTGHQYDRLRAVATFAGSCSDDAVRNGPTTRALQRIVSAGSFRGHRLAS
jgi:hypothetical protein